MRRATASPRATSLVNTEAPRPYGESLARRIASSASATFMIGSVGPKVSSVMHSIVWSTSTSTVGS